MLQEASDVLPPRHRELVATSLIGVEQLADTVHEFLDLTRIEAGELRLNLEPVHLTGLVTEVVRRAEPQASAQGISLQVRVDPQLPPVWGDHRRLRVVFDNIVSNALKYTPAGGRVALESGRSRSTGLAVPDRVTITISDTGPGVPPAFRDRIFDKFFRIEHQRPDDRRHPRGAGIGLYMCRQIVDLHGGRVSCAAGADDHGASITVDLPVGSAAGSVARHESVMVQGGWA